MARREYSAEERAAVIAACLAGQSISHAAKEYKIPKGTISSWLEREKEQLDRVRVDAAQAMSGGQAETELGGLLSNYLVASLDSLKNQVEKMGEKEYLDKQPIEGVAIAHGIQMDKAIRMIEAMSRAVSEPNTTEN